MTKDVPKIAEVLRTDESDELKRRRLIIRLAGFGLVDFTVISFYQTGIIKKLPDLPFKVFDSNAVNGSLKAYKSGLPDGTTALTVYALIMMLASYGGKKETGRSRMSDWLLLGAITGNSLAGLHYLYNMIFKQKKVCLYCVTGALINFRMLSPAFKNFKKY